LEGERESPSNGTTNIGEPIVDPIDEAKAGDIHLHLEDDEFSTPFQL
jgi:hypothetical protein